MEYIFILGRQPALSLAEILAVLKQQKISYKIISYHPEALVINVSQALDVDFLISRLGGTIKIGIIKQKIAAGHQLKNEEIKMKIIDLIKEKAKTGDEKKIYFGLSCYGKEQLIKLGIELKRELEKENIKSRFVISRETILSSVVVKTNKLLSERGIEIIVYRDEKEIWLGQTLAVQPFEELSARDYGRPSRDAYSGMLPPKLAKMMINLAEVGQEATILDPFCGSGTILTEAALMGYRNLLGSDISNKAIEDAKKNFDWLKKIFNISAQGGSASGGKYSILNIKKCDAQNLSRCFAASSIDAVITEPYLGPPLKGRESPEQINKIIHELSSLYSNALKEIHRVLKPDGCVVMVWPVFNKNKFLPLENEIKKTGFQIKPLLPASFASLLTPRGTLIYSRPEQRTQREMMKLIPKTTLLSTNLF